jgi:hypothetical protein
LEPTLANQWEKPTETIVKSKYIIITDCDGEEGVIVFSASILHRDVAGNFKIKSAGFCELKGTGNWVISGRSSSLRCLSRPEDVEILNQHLSSGEFSLSINRQAGR